MGWQTDLFCNITFNRQTYNNKYEVEDARKRYEDAINKCEISLKNLAVMTEPKKFCEEDEDPMIYIENKFDNNLEYLEDALIEHYKLGLLLENWDGCHDENGLAINPPDNMEYDTAFLDGDFIKTVKYPEGV